MRFWKVMTPAAVLLGLTLGWAMRVPAPATPRFIPAIPPCPTPAATEGLPLSRITGRYFSSYGIGLASLELFPDFTFSYRVHVGYTAIEPDYVFAGTWQWYGNTVRLIPPSPFSEHPLDGIGSCLVPVARGGRTYLVAETQLTLFRAEETRARRTGISWLASWLHKDAGFPIASPPLTVAPDFPDPSYSPTYQRLRDIPPIRR